MAYPTNPIYKLVKNIDGDVFAVKCEKPPFTKTIPFDEANVDYQDYLEWAKTNTAEAAD
tara:strand:- start:66 stop:242 length:177 start_codon:yes stop_codon:yes gene_type:complete